MDIASRYCLFCLIPCDNIKQIENYYRIGTPRDNTAFSYCETRPIGMMNSIMFYGSDERDP